MLKPNASTHSPNKWPKTVRRKNKRAKNGRSVACNWKTSAYKTTCLISNWNNNSKARSKAMTPARSSAIRLIPMIHPIPIIPLIRLTLIQPCHHVLGPASHGLIVAKCNRLNHHHAHSDRINRISRIARTSRINQQLNRVFLPSQPRRVYPLGQNQLNLQAQLQQATHPHRKGYFGVVKCF